MNSLDWFGFITGVICVYLIVKTCEKARLFNDYETLMEIIKRKHQKQIKDLGRQVKNFHEELKLFLLSTNERVLVEASPYDKVWGIGMKADENHIENPLLCNALNLLGFDLMEVRDKLTKIVTLWEVSKHERSNIVFKRRCHKSTGHRE